SQQCLDVRLHLYSASPEDQSLELTRRTAPQPSAAEIKREEIEAKHTVQYALGLSLLLWVCKYSRRLRECRGINLYGSAVVGGCCEQVDLNGKSRAVGEEMREEGDV